MPEERVKVTDPHVERLVAEGKSFDTALKSRASWVHRRAGRVRVVLARVRYKTVDAEVTPT